MHFGKIALISLLALFMLFVGYAKCTNMNRNDIGLKMLGLIKTIRGKAVDHQEAIRDSAPSVQHKIWSELLDKHVTEEGLVNYQGMIEDQQLFQEYLDLLSNNPPGKNWSTEEKIAYWINAYNAFTVKLVIDNIAAKVYLYRLLYNFLLQSVH